VRVVLNGNPEEIRAGVRACHKAAGPRFIVGAGCEIPRDTPHANLSAMRDYARAATPRTPA
jgi:uroporphyrinogen-III decarboxylase